MDKSFSKKKIMNNDAEERLNQFKADLNQYTSIQIARKHIIAADCFILYFHTLTAGDFTATRKMLIRK